MEPPPITESPALANLLAAGARQTAGTWQNLTATTANTVSGAFERALDAAWGKVATGAFDYKTAVKQAVDSLAQDLPMVTYPTGHTDSIEMAARRAVLTGVNQTAGKLQEARMDQMGAEFVETSAHGGARPSHAAWQGRRFHRGGAVDYLGVHYPDFAAATGYGTGAGLCGWNCRHSFFVVFPQLGDPPAWTREELAALNARDVEYNGKLYTRYEISQMQRARERNVRRWKKRYLAEDAAGLDPTDAALRLRAARQSLEDFTKVTGGRADSARITVPGFGRSEAGRAAWAAKKVTALNEALHIEPQPVTMQSIGNVKPFVCEMLDSAGQRQLQNAHKRLLMAASKQPLGVEVGRLFDLHMRPLTQDVVGNPDGHTVKLPNPDVPYVAIHTHPACGIFSNGDLSSFTRNKNLKLMTAIGHNGHIYAVEKSADFDAAAANGIVSSLNVEIARLKNIPRAELPDDQLLEQAEKLIRQAIGDLQQNGVRYYE